jgi:hypothetical protein
MSSAMEGVPELVNALKSVGASLAAEHVAAVTLVACHPTADAMREGCPRRTGRTAEGIQARLLEDGPIVVVGVGPHRDTPWAYGLEFGTATRPGGGFLRAGWDSDEAALKDRIRAGLAGLIEAAV